jgi:hypothetical protein
VQAVCPYKFVFEPSPPPDAERLSRNQDIPRPFVFQPPETSKTRFEKDEALDFGLVIIGRAFEFTPYFVLSFQELGEQGLGLNRARCTLTRVEEIDPLSLCSPPYETRAKQVYSAHDRTCRSAAGIDSLEWVESRLDHLYSAAEQARASASPREAAEDPAIERITIRFSTPTFIRADGRVIRSPDFHHLFKRLRDRVNALHTFFGEGPLDADFRGLGDRSEQIRTVSSRFDWIERARTSSKTKQRHELSGFAGEATYEGELAEFLPWLALGELIHVGRHTAWGNGRFQLIAPSLPSRG